MRLFREELPKLGRMTTAMLDSDIPLGEKSAIYVDHGHRGIQKYLYGDDIYMPIKRNVGSDPKTGRLSQ